MTYEVEKYLTVVKWNGKNKYKLQVGGLELYFTTKKEAEEYYQAYLK
jgi:hypothetical protein